MKEIFENKTPGNFRRAFALAATSCMLTVAMTGCFGGNTTVETVPPTEPPILLEDETPTTEATTLPTETESSLETPNVVVDGKMITVTGAPVEVRSAVGADGLVMGKLEVGTQSEILRQVELDGINWALVREGWICLDNVDLDDLPADEDSSDDITVVPDEEKDDKPLTPHRPSMDGVDSAVNESAQTVNKKGVVTANGLNVRSEPSTTAKVVDALKKGETVTVIEKKGNWGHIQNGWISLKYVNLTGEAGSANNNTNNNNNQTDSGNANVIAKGIVTTDGLNIRSGAGTEYGAVGSYNYGDRVEFTEKRSVNDGEWGKTSKGWIYLSYVYMDGSRSNEAVKGTVTGSAVNVRSGPGTGYKVVGGVKAGDSVEVLAQFKYGKTTWGCLNNGWISMDYVKTN